MRPMRRQDREVKAFSEIVGIIRRSDILRLGLADQDGPYIVPLHFGYEVDGENVCFYFHSAVEGRKVDIIRSQPRVCFEMEGAMEIRPDEKDCAWGASFESVMGTGSVLILENEQDKIHGLTCLMKNYGHEGIPQFQTEMLQKTLVIKLDVESMTGKRRE